MKEKCREIRKYEENMKEALKIKTLRRNEFGLVAYFLGTIKSVGVFNT